MSRGGDQEVREQFSASRASSQGTAFLPEFLKLCSFNRSYLTATDPDSFLASWETNRSPEGTCDDLMQWLLTITVPKNSPRESVRMQIPKPHPQKL